MTDVTLTPHAITTFRLRASLHSVVEAVDRLQELLQKAQRIGQQRRKGRVVSVLRAEESDRAWTLYVQGRVLLTVHGPHSLGVSPPGLLGNRSDTHAAS